ncbi:MAG TPA: hypothetical protein VGZ29_05665 [Terriglobia bacterium]|nr:hypothetical protein [Terriglobia bacterium]
MDAKQQQKPDEAPKPAMVPQTAWTAWQFLKALAGVFRGPK